MKTLAVSGSAQPAIVDDSDYEAVVIYRWCMGGNNNHYVHARINGRNHKLSRLILGFPQQEISFKDGDRLNHQRSNLIIATHQQTTFNQGMRSNNKSGYKGVSWDNARQKWYAYIMIDGKTKSLGRFNNKHEAAIAYNIAALDSYGDEYAAINIVRTDEV